MEARPGIEPGCKDLQAHTSRAISNASLQTGSKSGRLKSKAWGRRANQSGPPEVENAAHLGKGGGALGSLEFDGSGRLQPYRKAPSRATLTLREIRDEQGRFQGLEAVAYG